MDDADERMRILEMIDSGKISAEQGLSLLQALGAASSDDFWDETAQEGSRINSAELPLPGIAEPVTAAPAANPEAGVTNDTGEVIYGNSTGSQDRTSWGSLGENAGRLKRMWVIPMWIGVGATVVGALLMSSALLRSEGMIGLLFLCASVPFALGLLVMTLAWASRSAPWLHLRIQQPPGAAPQRLALSFPLPFGLGAWFVRTFGSFIPNLRDQPVDEILQMVRQTTISGAPIYIEVDEGENGEKVEIIIG